MQHLARAMVGLALASVSMVVVSPAPAAAQSPASATVWRDYCNGVQGRTHDDLRIGGCTAVLSNTENSPADIAAFLTRRGMAYMSAGELDLANSDFRAALTLSPQRASTLLERAVLLRRLGQLEASLADVNRFVSLEPEDINGLTERCRILSVLGRDFEAAEADCNEALNRRPGLWYAHRNRAILRIRQNRLDAALEDLAAAEAGGSPAFSDFALYARGVIKLQRGETAEGEADMQKATQGSPELPSTFLAYGLPGGPPVDLANDPAFQAAMRVAEGQSFETSTDQCSDGEAVDELKAVAACTALLRQARLTMASIPQVLIFRAAHLIDAGRIFEAAEDLDHVLSLETDNPVARLLRAEIRLRQGRLDEGLVDADRAVTLLQTIAAPRAIRASIFVNKGEHARAILDLDEAIRLEPETAEYSWRRGESWLNLDSHARAIADYDRAIELDPRNAFYLNGRCWARVLQGRQLEMAMADCEAALRLSDEPYILDSRAAVKLVSGDHSGAFADFDAAFRRDPAQYVSQYGRGLALIRLGQVEAGRRDIAAALAAQPDVATDYERMGQTP